MVCIKIPRCDTNEGGAIEVTVTSELHVQAERAQKQKREEKRKLHPVEAQAETEHSMTPNHWKAVGERTMVCIEKTAMRHKGC